MIPCAGWLLAASRVLAIFSLISAISLSRSAMRSLMGRNMGTGQAEQVGVFIASDAELSATQCPAGTPPTIPISATIGLKSQLVQSPLSSSDNLHMIKFQVSSKTSVP